jgi:hypothetical protein
VRRAHRRLIDGHLAPIHAHRLRDHAGRPRLCGGFHFGGDDQAKAVRNGIQACMESSAPADVKPGSKRKYCTCIARSLTTVFSTDTMMMAMTMALGTKEQVKADKDFRRYSARFSRRCLQQL